MCVVVIQVNLHILILILLLVDGNWAVWGSWSACSMTCNPGSDLIIMGTERRSRTCSDPAPQNGGNPCNGIDTDTHHCQQTTLCPGT